MTVHARLHRDVFTRDHPDRLFHYLANLKEPVLYTHARDALNLKPEEHRRALQALATYALVEKRVVPRRERLDERRRVLIRLSALGHSVSRAHTASMNAWAQAFEGEKIDSRILDAK